MKTNKRASTKRSTKAKPEKVDLKAAFVIPKEEMIKVVNLLRELPHKYTPIINEILMTFEKKTFRSDVNLTITDAPVQKSVKKNGVPEPPKPKVIEEK